MELAIACGSIFVGVSTLMGWLLWRMPHLPSVATPAVPPKEQGAGREGAFAQLKGLERKLFIAGYRTARAKLVITAFRMLTVASGGVAAWGGYRAGLSMRTLSLVALAVASSGWIVPHVWLSGRISQRTREIGKYLTDTLDLFVICLEAGLGFNAALTKVAAEQKWTSPVLSDELQCTNREVLMGRPRAEALRSLGERCANEDFKGLLTIIIQAEKFGMSMAKTMRIQVEAMRQKRRQKVQEQIHKMPVKMVFPLVFCIFPELLTILLGPAAISIYQNYIKGGF